MMQFAWAFDTYQGNLELVDILDFPRMVFTDFAESLFDTSKKRRKRKDKK